MSNEDMGKVRKDAAAEVQQEQADAHAVTLETAAEKATADREAAEEEQRKVAKTDAVAEAAAQKAVDDARAAEDAAKKAASEGQHGRKAPGHRTGH